MTTTPPPAPSRRSIKDRMAQGTPKTTSEPPVSGPDTSSSASLLTDTSMTAVGAHTLHDLAFRVGNEGDVQSDEAAPLAAPLKRSEPLTAIDRHTATGHHLLVLAEAVDADELEALAVSIWEEAGWTAPGMLRLSGGARLEGPWHLPTELRQEFSIPADLDTVWLLVCAPQRSTTPTLARTYDRWAGAFPAGAPCGVEAKMLLTLERMARRLAGVIRIAGSGALIEPDPDSAVSLTVHAPRWLDPQDVLALFLPEFPDIADAREQVADSDSAEDATAPPPRRSTKETAAAAALREQMPKVAEEITAKIEADRQKDLVRGQLLDGYSLITPVGNRSRMAVEVRVTNGPVPQALRWEPWADSTVIEYRLRWLPPAGTPGVSPSGVALPAAVLSSESRRGMSRAARLERLRAAKDIEKAAALVRGAVGGAILDEDGFLVALD